MADNQFTKEELATEEWRQIPDYEGFYSVSNLGRVRRDTATSNYQIGHISKPYIDKSGYRRVALCVRGRVRFYGCHALVALAFIGPRPPGLVINHKDGVKTNNHPDNLEYCTGAYNMRHASEHGLMSCGERHAAFTRPNTPRGERNHKAKLTTERVLEVRAKHSAGRSAYSLGFEYGVTKQSILAIVRRETWTHI